MLPEAVKQGDLSSVKRILDSVDESVNLLHGSSVCLAASRGHRDIVELLLGHGFDVNIEDSQGHTPIYYTVTQDDVRTTELLLQHGAKTNEKNDLIFTAARKNYGGIVKVLVDFGADVNAKDDYLQTPLHHAILRYTAEFLFFKETDSIDISAMENVVRVLLCAGSEVNAKTVNGFSPLHFAIKLKYPSIVSVLLEHGADFRSLVDCDIKTPRLSQFRLRSSRSLTLGRVGPRPRLTTVLHVAAESNDTTSLTTLLTAGSAVDSVRYDGATPLIVAIKRQHDEVVSILLDYRADLEQRSKYGMTPLHVACRKCSIKVLNVLLEAGANVNAVCNKGRVPYQYVLQLVDEMYDEYLFECYSADAPQYYHQRYKCGLIMKKILQKHLTVMNMNGFHLQDYNKMVAMKTPNIFHFVSTKNYEEFSKSVVVFNNLTLYNVINTIRNPFYLRNPDVLKGLDQAVAATKAVYPVFGKSVTFLAKNARVRVDLIDTGIEWFVNLNKMNCQLSTLPFDVLEIVFSFLLNEEIQNFIDCVKSLWN